MDKAKKFMLEITLGCLAIVTGITAWIISINDTYSVDSASGYTVTLIATGGTITDGTKEHGSTFKIEEIKKFNYGDYTADKDGYKFTGWGASGCTTGKLTGEENLTSHTTYHACFTEITSTTTKYKVTFNANGGKFSNGENIQTVEYDEKYLLENLTVSKTDTSCSSGYELEGWNDGSKILTSYVDSAEDGKTLTAKWGSCKTSTTDPEPTDPDPTPTDPEPTDPDPTPTPGETETHNVTLNANGGTIKGKNKEIVNIENISTFDYSSYTANKDGITFNGWGTTTSCTEGKLKDEIELKQDMYFMACYKNTINFHFDTDEYELCIMNDKCYEGKNDVFSVDVSTTEINFTTYYLRDKTTEKNAGATWSSKKGCYHSADTSEWLKGTQEIYDDFDAYACISNTATFETYGGKLINDGDEISKTTFKINNISLIWAEKDNTDFLGWTTTENDCKNPIKTGPTVEDPDSDDRTWVDGDTTYYACYGETTETKYTVTFNLNGGDTLYKNGTKTSKNTEELAIVYYKSYTASKTGSTFTGWSSSKNCTNVNSEGTLSLTKKTTLYACYKSNDSGGIGGGDDDNIDENVGTGSLLYITYILGISSLLYTVYYIYKLKKNTPKEL